MISNSKLFFLTLVVAFILALFSTNTLATFTLSSCAQRCNGVNPFYKDKHDNDLKD